MKKLFSLVPLIFLIAVGCNTTSSDNQTFTNNVACNNIRTNIQTSLQKKYSNNHLESVQDFQLFFSPKENSCVYAFKAFAAFCGVNKGCPDGSGYDDYYDDYVEFGINNAFTDKQLFFKSVRAGLQVTSAQAEYDSQVKQLQ